MSDAAVEEKKEVVVSDDVKKVLDSINALSGADKAVVILEMVKSMSGLELVDASKLMEEQLDITAAGGGGGMMMMAPAGGDAGGAPAVEEKTDFDVHLTSYGDKKIAVIKAVRTLTGKGLKEAKEIVDGVPAVLAEGLPQEEADKYKAEIEGAGGSVELK